MKKSALPLSLLRQTSTAAVLTALLCTSLHVQASKKNVASAPAARSYAQNEDAMQMASDIAQRRNIPLAWVQATLAEARFLPQVPRLMTPPGKRIVRNYTVYRSRFVEPIRIRAGQRFWQENQATLERAERQFGVPAEIIVGIIGVETIYGQQMGNMRVLDALATLSFDFPAAHPKAASRNAYFRGELEQFLVMNYNSGVDPSSVRGSYAGAMGLGQFMPTSWGQWAVDFDGDGRIDLFRSTADAIGSVANYFVAHGWKPGMPAFYPVQVPADETALRTLLAPDINPTFSAAQMLSAGTRLLDGGDKHNGPLALVEFPNGSNGPPFYLAGTENFYAVTRYNWSSFYALSVLELGAEVKAAYLAQARSNNAQTVQNRAVAP